MDLGLAGPERPSKGSPGVKHSGRRGAPGRRLLARVFVAAMAAVLCTLGLSAVAGQAARAAGTPTMTSIFPISGVDIGGTSVTIIGTDFTNATEVDFGTDSANFRVVSDTEIIATTPAEADGTVDVTVVTPDGSADIQNGDPANGGYTFEHLMTITGISPTSGPVGGGGTMTITGAGFTGTSFVIFQQSPIFGQPRSTRASFTVDSDTQITVTIPPAPAGVPGVAGISVVSPVPRDTSKSVPLYNYVSTPTVTGVSGNFGLVSGGTTVTVSGTGFTSGTTVQFGSIPATSVTVHSNTSLSVVSPPNSAGVAEITVTNQVGTSAVSLADQFTYLPLPAVTGVSPAVGPAAGGNNIIITGTTFMLPNGNLTATEVDFGSVPARGFFVNSATQITVEVPPGSAGTVDVTVKTSAGTTTVTSADQYTYFPLPAVTGVSPSSGPIVGGNPVTITGTGFTGASAVSFDSVPATSFTVNSDTSITATVPAGVAGAFPLVGVIDDVTVTTPGGTSATSTADQYTYEPVPAVTGVSPSSGPIVGGNTVTVTGADFTGGTGFITPSAVLFGTVPATSFTVNDDGSITAVVPAGAVGIVDVTVTTSGGTSPVSAADQYVYHPTCTTTITGTHATQLNVTSGLTCLVNATQSGRVTVGPGAALSVTNSNVQGTVTATSPSGITYCGSTEAGGLSVTGATGPVVLGGALPDGTACTADMFSGPVTVTGATAPVTVTGLDQQGTLTLENDTAGVTLDGSQLDGRALVENNTATAPAVITVSGNTVNGSLYCTGNNPAPGDNGSINTVSGTATDQCAGIAER